MSTAMFIGAHPDDVELGAAGAVLQMAAQGHRIFLADLTDGEETPCGDRVTRKKETAEANRILGVSERECLDLPNRVLMDTEDARAKLAVLMRRVRPDIIISHLHDDVHPDHVAAYQITRGAALLSRIHKTDMPGQPWKPGRIFSYPCYHLQKSYNPSFVLKVSKEHFEKKLAAVRAYESQFVKHPPNQAIFKIIEARMRYFGGMVGSEYGEPYFCESPPGVTGLFEVF